MVIKAKNLGLKDYPIVAKLQKQYTMPIFLKNDAKCAAICEKEYGSLKEYTNSIFLTIGTGIGGAIIWNNELLIPTKYPGFEIGHMIIEKDGKQCSCGKKGCFETYASIVALKQQVMQNYYLSENITGKELLDQIRKDKKDEKMQGILGDYVEYLSIGISNLINIFEPEVISIGGSFTYYEEIFLDKLKNKLQDNHLLFNNSMPQIILATRKNDAGIIGASRIQE